MRHNKRRLSSRVKIWSMMGQANAPKHSIAVMQLTRTLRSPFHVKQYALSVDAPPVAAQPTVSAQRTMTRDQHADPVSAARARGGTNRQRDASAPRNLGVGDDLARLDTKEKTPDSNLERCAAKVYR